MKKNMNANTNHKFLTSMSFTKYLLKIKCFKHIVFKIDCITCSSYEEIYIHSNVHQLKHKVTIMYTLDSFFLANVSVSWNLSSQSAHQTTALTLALSSHKSATKTSIASGFSSSSFRSLAEDLEQVEEDPPKKFKLPK